MDFFNSSVPGGFIPGSLTPGGWSEAGEGGIPVTIFVTGFLVTTYVGSVFVTGSAEVPVIGHVVNISLGDVIPTSVVAVSGYDVFTDVGGTVVHGAANVSVSGFNVVTSLGTISLCLSKSQYRSTSKGVRPPIANRSRLIKHKIIPRKYTVYVDGFDIIGELGDIEISIVATPTKRIVVKKLPVKLQRPQIKLITNSIKLATQPIELPAKPQIKLVRPMVEIAKKIIVKKHKPISLIRKQIRVIEASGDQQHTPIKLIKRKIVLANTNEV